MNFTNQGSSDSSSEEYNHHYQTDQFKSDDTEFSKRSYECTFCKRGFTNAQALGGHMNIHRKDRAKAKTKQLPVSVSSLPNKALDQSSHQTNQYPYFDSQMNYQMYNFQPSGSIPTYPNHDWFVQNSSQPLSMTEELLGTNLSLQIGSTISQDDIRLGVWKNDDVDLELRLGYDP